MKRTNSNTRLYAQASLRFGSSYSQVVMRKILTMRYLAFIFLFLISGCALGQVTDRDKSDSDSVFNIVEYPAHPVSGNFANWKRELLRKVDTGGSQYLTEYLSCWKAIEFVVEKNGELTWIGAPRCANKDIRDAVRKAIEEGDQFVPAKHKGQVVRQRMYVSFSCIKLN